MQGTTERKKISKLVDKVVENVNILNYLFFIEFIFKLNHRKNVIKKMILFIHSKNYVNISNKVQDNIGLIALIQKQALISKLKKINDVP